MSSLKYCLCQLSKGGAIYRVVDGSLNFRILFIRLAALVLFGSFCGSKPITAILDCGNLLEIKLTVLQMVFAIVSNSLLLLFLRLFVPIQSSTFPGASGQAPCCSRQATCSTLSPPMPKLCQFERCCWKREDRAGRERRSK